MGGGDGWGRGEWWEGNGDNYLNNNKKREREIEKKIRPGTFQLGRQSAPGSEEGKGISPRSGGRCGGRE